MLQKKVNEPTYVEGVVAKATELENWLDGATVEDLLNISTRTLQYYRSMRMIPYLKIGNKIYYKRSDIEAYMEDRYAAQNPKKGGMV